MKPERKAVWVEALESGVYKPGRMRLVRSEIAGKQYWCCLGVLCDLALKSGEVPGLIRDGDYFVETTCESGVPPEAVFEWAGLTQDEAAFLADINDTGAPFRVIASYIRRHL